MMTLTKNARETHSSDLPQAISRPPQSNHLHVTSLVVGHPKQVTTFDWRPIELPVKGIQRDIVVKFATEKQEWEEAFKLVAANYRARGYEGASTKPLRFTPYHALPDTVTLVAKHAGHVVATFSIVLDNVTKLGLPMESIYPDEIARLRGEGRRLLETTSLADESLSIREFMQVFVTLIRLGMQYHTSQGGDTFAITVNPRHKSFYEKILGFQSMGPRRSYACVQDAPAEALWVDRVLLKERAPRMYDEIFGEPLPASALVPHRLSRNLIRHFDENSSLGNVEAIEDVFSFVDHFGSPRRW